jgi:tetratricopeptide (TPR) repeat protein
MKIDSPLLNKPQIHFKLVRSLAAQNGFEDVAAQGYAFLDLHKNAAEEPEVRFFLASALKHLGRNNESLQQVLALLLNQSEQAKANPAVWAHWQQRTGNEVANQLYKEGDYLRALEVYSNLAALNTNADWQLPAWYQMGLAYERLQQPGKAIEQYVRIRQRESTLSTNTPAAVRTVLDMARWRGQYLGWQTNTESMTRELKTARLVTPEPSTSKQ